VKGTAAAKEGRELDSQVNYCKAGWVESSTAPNSQRSPALPDVLALWPKLPEGRLVSCGLALAVIMSIIYLPLGNQIDRRRKFSYSTTLARDQQGPNV
jgi:hypothetical protein